MTLDLSDSHLPIYPRSSKDRPERPTSLDDSKARVTVLAVDVGGGCLDIFSNTCHFFFSFSLSLGDGSMQTKILSQRTLNPKQPTNQIKREKF